MKYVIIVNNIVKIIIYYLLFLVVLNIIKIYMYWDSIKKIFNNTYEYKLVSDNDLFKLKKCYDICNKMGNIDGTIIGCWKWIFGLILDNKYSRQSLWEPYSIYMILKNAYRNKYKKIGEINLYEDFNSDILLIELEIEKLKNIINTNWDSIIIEPIKFDILMILNYI